MSKLEDEDKHHRFGTSNGHLRETVSTGKVQNFFAHGNGPKNKQRID